jgi:hypothetical protein
MESMVMDEIRIAESIIKELDSLPGVEVVFNAGYDGAPRSGFDLLLVEVTGKFHVEIQLPFDDLFHFTVTKWNCDWIPMSTTIHETYLEAVKQLASVVQNE